MIPNNQIDFDVTENEPLPSLTYRIDFTNKKVSGMISGAEALTQTAYDILDTERYAYLIYNWFYGVEIEDTIGQDFEFIQANIGRVIVDGLTQDDRITGIQNLSCERTDLDSMLVKFEMITTEGIIPMEKEYKYNG